MMRKGNPVKLTDHNLTQEDIQLYRQVARDLFGKDFANNIVFAEEVSKGFGRTGFEAESGLKVKLGGFFRQRGKFMEKFLLTHSNLPNPRMADCAARERGVAYDTVAMISEADLKSIIPAGMTIEECKEAINRSFEDLVSVRQKRYEQAQAEKADISDDDLDEVNEGMAHNREEYSKMVYSGASHEKAMEKLNEADEEQEYAPPRHAAGKPRHARAEKSAETPADYDSVLNDEMNRADDIQSEREREEKASDSNMEDRRRRNERESDKPKNDSRPRPRHATQEPDKNPGDCMVEINSRDDRRHFAELLAGAGIIEYEIGYGRDGNAIITAPLESRSKILDMLQDKGYEIRDDKVFLGNFSLSEPHGSVDMSKADGEHLMDMLKERNVSLSAQMTYMPELDRYKMTYNQDSVLPEVIALSKATGAKSKQAKEKQEEQVKVKAAEGRARDDSEKTPMSDFLVNVGKFFAPENKSKGPDHDHDILK